MECLGTDSVDVGMPQNRLNTPLSILYALEICSYNDVTMIIKNPNHTSLASEQQLEDISPELVSVESYLRSYLVFYPVFSSSPIIQGVFFTGPP